VGRCYCCNIELTPPTEEEVCKAIVEHFQNSNVKYKNGAFVFAEDEDMIVYAYINNLGFIRFNYSLPPYLITLIGRFYEGVSDNA